MKKIFLVIIVGLLLVSCKSKDSKNKGTDSADTTGSKTVYNFAKHDDITVFMDDLSKAATAGDKAALAQMTSFPFADQWPQFITGNEKDSAGVASLAAKDSAEFVAKYDQLFIPQLLDELKNKKYRGYEKNEQVPDVIEEGEYLVLAESMVNNRQYGLAIKKLNGLFKIFRTAFSS